MGLVGVTVGSILGAVIGAKVSPVIVEAVSVTAGRTGRASSRRSSGCRWDKQANNNIYDIVVYYDFFLQDYFLLLK